MKVNFKISLKTAGSQIDPAFLKRFIKFRDGRTSVFLFDDAKKAKECIKYCNKEKMRFHSFYEFVITMNEIESDTVFIFGLENTEGLMSGSSVNEEVFGVMDIRQDADSGNLIVSERAKEVIESNSTGVSFSPLGGFYRVEGGHTGLSLTVPKTLEEGIGIGPAHSDGRYVGSLELFDAVAANGLVTVNSFVVEGESRTISPPARLINGNLFKALVSYRMKGMRLGNQIWVLHPESTYATD